MANFQELQEAVLFEIWDVSYHPSIKSPFNPWTLGEIKPRGVSDTVVRKAVDALVDRGFLDRTDKESGEFEISARGLSYVEAQLEDQDSYITQYSESRGSNPFELIAEDWRSPDKLGAISATAISEIKGHLAECIKLIAQSELSQEEKAQVHGLLKICEDIIDLPTPKITIIVRVLRWLREIPEIADLVQRIIEYFE